MVAEVDLFYTPKKELPLSYVGEPVVLLAWTQQNFRSWKKSSVWCLDLEIPFFQSPRCFRCCGSTAIHLCRQCQDFTN